MKILDIYSLKSIHFNSSLIQSYLYEYILYIIQITWPT